jgi:C4-dicarboxylate-binding protein DctP
MKIASWTLSAAAIALLALAPASAQQPAPIILKFSHVVTADTPKGKGSERFKELAEKYTNGRVKVEVYPNSTLYKDKEELEALQLGAVQMLAPSNSKFGPLGLKEFEVLDLPMLIPSLAQLRKVTEGPIGISLLNKLDTVGLIGLGYWDNGFKVMTANKPLRNVDDFKGVKMRIQSSKVLHSQFKALGSLPQTMAFGEVYQALQTGVVDGQENTPANIYSQKMNEVQKYMTLSNHGYIGYVVVVGKPFWNGLPADIREQLTKAMNESTKYVNEISQAENDAAVAAIRKAGKTEIINLTPAQNDEWRKAMAPVYEEMGERVGKQLIQDIQKTVAVTN